MAAGVGGLGPWAGGRCGGIPWCGHHRPAEGAIRPLRDRCCPPQPFGNRVGRRGRCARTPGEAACADCGVFADVVAAGCGDSDRADGGVVCAACFQCKPRHDGRRTPRSASGTRRFVALAGSDQAGRSCAQYRRRNPFCENQWTVCCVACLLQGRHASSWRDSAWSRPRVGGCATVTAIGRSATRLGNCPGLC